MAGVTPEIDDPFRKAVRQTELEQWLIENGRNLSTWIAIDDVPAFYKKDAPVIVVDGAIGFTGRDAMSLNALIMAFRDEQ